VDDFLSFSDTNDDEFLAAAASTPAVQGRTDQRQVARGSADISGIKMMENSQLTFTQALACVHDLVNIRTGSPNVHGKSGKVDFGLETSVRMDEAQFDLGFEFSDDDDDDWNDNVNPAGDVADNSDADDDIIPPSPPASSCWKSSLRLGSRSDSLATISRQNSCGSVASSGRQTSLAEDATNVHGLSSRKSELVPEGSDVRNVSKHLLPEMVTKGSASLVQNVEQTGAAAVEKKSTNCLFMPRFSPPAVEQKLIDTSCRSESSVMAMEQKSTDFLSASRLDSGAADQKSRFPAVEVERKSRERKIAESDAVATEEKSTDLVRTNPVAVIRPFATPTTPASQSEVTSLPAALCSSTPLKLGTDEKCGESPFCYKIVI